MRAEDEAWMEAEDGAWFRLADVLLFEVEERVAVELPARVVAVMRYAEEEVDGELEQRRLYRPYRLVLSTHTDRQGAVEALRNVLIDSLAIATVDGP